MVQVKNWRPVLFVHEVRIAVRLRFVPITQVKRQHVGLYPGSLRSAQRFVGEAYT